MSNERTFIIKKGALVELTALHITGYILGEPGSYIDPDGTGVNKALAAAAVTLPEDSDNEHGVRVTFTPAQATSLAKGLFATMDVWGGQTEYLTDMALSVRDQIMAQLRDEGALS